MAERTDEAKGRAKQAAGDITGDERLRREGKVDRASADVKERVSGVADKVKEKLGRRRER